MNKVEKMELRIALERLSSTVDDFAKTGFTWDTIPKETAKAAIQTHGSLMKLRKQVRDCGDAQIQSDFKDLCIRLLTKGFGVEHE